VVLNYAYPAPPPQISYPVAWVGGPQQVPVVELIGTNGDVLNLSGDGLHGFNLMEERGIFGAPNMVPQMVSGAGEGAHYDGSKTGAKTVDLKVDVKGDSIDDLAALLRRLANVILAGQPAWLRVTPRAAGLAGARWLPVVYNGGWDGSGSGFDHLVVPLALVSPEPYWLGVTPVTPEPWVVRSGKGLLGTTPFFPVRLGQSQVLGSIELTNPGDLDAYASWLIGGPGGPVSILPGTGERGFSIDYQLEPGEELLASRAGGPVSLTDANTGEDRYELFGPAPMLWLIPPGQSTAYVEVLQAQAGTSVELQFVPRYWLGA